MERDAIVSGRPSFSAVTREHWCAVDPTLPAYVSAYDELRSRWRAQKPLRGWKIGAHHASGRALLGLQTSLLGFLPTTTQCPEHALIDLRGTKRPGIEAEIAVHIGRPVAANDSAAALESAIEGLTIAAEIVDLDGDHTDPRNVLRRNMFHHGFVLPGISAPRPIGEYDATVVRIELNGQELAVASPIAVLGDIRWIVAFVAASLARMGEEFEAGHVILTGAVTPLPIWVKPLDGMTICAGPLGRLELKFKAGEEA